MRSEVSLSLHVVQGKLWARRREKSHCLNIHRGFFASLRMTMGRFRMDTNLGRTVRNVQGVQIVEQTSCFEQAMRSNILKGFSDLNGRRVPRPSYWMRGGRGMGCLFDRNCRGTSRGIRAGYRVRGENGETPKSCRGEFPPGMDPAFFTCPGSPNGAEPYENLAARIGGLWLMISLG